MSSVTVHLRDINVGLVAAWERYFANVPAVEVSRGDIFGARADAIVSPANGFGFMDGGIDAAYSRRFGWQLQERLQSLLRTEYDGELPVGMAVLLGTGDPEIPYVVSAPTMRAPANVADTLNSYLAFRAALRIVRRHNDRFPGAIRSVLCPGLGTATGDMPVEICVKQMRAAYDQTVGEKPWRPTSVNDAIIEHYRLLRAEE
jgi:O-acetyl-ADP-ribose deacetylase (regulator of RNase III)